MTKEWWDKLRNNSGKMSDRELIDLVEEAERIVFEGRDSTPSQRSTEEKRRG